MDAAEVQKALALSADEDFILTAWQYRMMQRDIASSRGKHLSSKREVRNAFRTAAAVAIARRDTSEYSGPILDAAQRVAGPIEQPDLEALEDAGPEVSGTVPKRSRALLLLIDLYGFEPWTSGKWDSQARGKTLAEAHQAMGGQLLPEDLESVETAYRDAIRKLSKSRSWRKLALLAGVGVGVGVVTGGLAAPVIAGAYGTAVLGYSGAVATSAGLAALGGGSVAAGGLGMAGGAALISGLSGVAAAGAATLGGKATGYTAAHVAADAVRLHVVTQLVLRDVDGNEEAAKAVIVSLHERVANLGKTVAALGDRIEALRSQLQAKESELDEERARRAEAEDRAARLRSMVDRLKAQVVGPEDEDVKALISELSELEEQKEATEALAAGVDLLAHDLEAAA